ncbi:MAG TPA: hypothetical protein VGG28_16890 [Kofleriaceae bacterium]
MLWLLVFACTTPIDERPPNWRGVDGKPSDSHVVDGTYPGFRVIRRCPLAPDEVGVLGTGSACFEGTCGRVADEVAAFQLFRLELREAIPFVWSGDGIGARCTPGDRMAARLSVYDWRALDEAVRRVGALLRKYDLREEVVISVSGDPVRY